MENWFRRRWTDESDLVFGLFLTKWCSKWLYICILHLCFYICLLYIFVFIFVHCICVCTWGGQNAWISYYKLDIESSSLLCASCKIIIIHLGDWDFHIKFLARGEPTCPTWIGMTLDFVKRQKSIHRILCQSPVPLSRGSLSEKIILSHCKVWILSLMAFPHRSGFVVTWYFPQTCHKTQTHKHTHKHTREKIPHTKTRVWRHGYTKWTLHTKTSFCQLKPLATITTKKNQALAKHKHKLWSPDMAGQTQTQAMVTWYVGPNTNTILWSPDMAGKLVTSRELLGATAPIARERALAWDKNDIDK